MTTKHKLTQRQLDALKMIRIGGWRSVPKRDLNSLIKLGLVVIRPPIGWCLNYAGDDAIAKATGESK